MPDPTYNEARERAVASLFRRRTSSGGMVRYLLKLGYEEQLAKKVAADLLQDNYLDDHKVARAIIKGRSGRRAESIALLEKRLRQRGVPAPAAQEVLAQLAAEGFNDTRLAADWLRACYRNELLRWREEAEVLDEGQKAQLLRIKRQAAGRGFSPELIERILRGWRVPTV